MTTIDNIIKLKNRLSKMDLKFNSVESSEIIEKFEKDHNITLPIEYKLFIQHIGNGGDGPPDYGIIPIGKNEIWWSENQQNAWLKFKNIAKPFPFVKPWIWEDDQLENLELKDRIFDGNIYLGTDGCGMDWTLVVSGEQHGFVWQITDIGIVPCSPPMTFFQWFNKWLDHDKSNQDPFWWTD